MANILSKEEIIRTFRISEEEYDKAQSQFCNYVHDDSGGHYTEREFREEASELAEHSRHHDAYFFRAAFDLPQEYGREELTTLMHAEFMEGEISELQLRCLAAWSQMETGKKSKADALRANGLTDEEFNENIDAAFKA